MQPFEKDWGQSFPAVWFWFPYNHFDDRYACITTSVAIILLIGQAFRGFIVGLWLDDKLHRFAIFDGARIKSLRGKVFLMRQALIPGWK